MKRLGDRVKYTTKSKMMMMMSVNKKYVWLLKIIVYSSIDNGIQCNET